MVCAEQLDTRMRVAQKKATEWLKLFSGSISPNHDSGERWNHYPIPKTFKSQPQHSLVQSAVT
ncbi:hypothetical protein F4W67_06500 [Pseudomonas caricapapayae]|nr:hypothetical protein F4W67_06500 [Pseudomonas caricapapayae]